MSFHNRHQPFGRLPTMKSVRLNATYGEVKMSERLKSTLIYYSGNEFFTLATQKEQKKSGRSDCFL